jgi:hypothetical protein
VENSAWLWTRRGILSIFRPVIFQPSRTCAAIAALAAVLSLSACDRLRHHASTQSTASSAPVTSGAPPTQPAQPLAVAPPDLPEQTLPGMPDGPRNLDVSVLHLGRIVIALERNYLRDVQSQIGAGMFDEQGDGGDFRTWLCYTIPHSSRVWLISSQTGAGQYVNSFVVQRDVTAEASDHCPALPAQYTPIVLEPDIHLGTPERQVEQRYGAPQRQDPWVSYSHTDSSNHDSLHFDVAHKLWLQYENGAVSAFGAHKDTAAGSNQ